MTPEAPAPREQERERVYMKEKGEKRDRQHISVGNVDSMKHRTERKDATLKRARTRTAVRTAWLVPQGRAETRIIDC